MTCQELRDYFQLDERDQTGATLDSTDLAEHIDRCHECCRLVEAQKELLTALDRMRGSAPPIPASLDSAVLTNYRKYVSGQLSCVGPVLLGRRRALATLGWAAVAFAVMVAYAGMVLFLPGERLPAWNDRQRVAQAPKLSQTPTTANGALAPAQRLAPKAPKSRLRPVRRTSESAAVVAQDQPLPTGFRSLMYCDELTCAGAMEVIRVQLPTPILRLPSAPARANALVSADVLVGPDGIARGIRVVE